MLHPKQHIRDLSEICYHYGVQYVIISPGSRNAPLIEAFLKRFKDNCISIVDERSAGYFALGLARKSGSPVVLICTSGTAVLNYGPALAEAYYQRIPLIALTADRPEELIDQQDNQTIRQRGIFKNITKGHYHLFQNISSKAILSEVHKQIERAIEKCLEGAKGPVHINVPLSEPLYDNLPETSPNLITAKSNGKKSLICLSNENCEKFRQAGNILIIHGQDFQDSETPSLLNSLSQNSGILVVAENIANTTGEKIIDIPELLLTYNNKDSLILPDLVIYSGGQIVSKKLKLYVRGLKNVECWRVGEDEYTIDTFQKSNEVISGPHSEVYAVLNSISRKARNEAFKESWLVAKRAVEEKRAKILKEMPFSDLKVHHLLLEKMPVGINLELGNSSIIRYTQVFNTKNGMKYYSNRGASGIDGCLSAACGTAFASDELTVAIVGDLSFVYDSNALWNRELSKNLRIVVINNSGGDIFGLIEGPSRSPGFIKYYRAHHPVEIQKLAEAFNLGYFCIENEYQLEVVLQKFLKKSERALLMEVKTNEQNNKKSFNLITGRISSIDDPE